MVEVDRLAGPERALLLARVTLAQSRLAATHPLICGEIDHARLLARWAEHPEAVRVAHRHGRVVGHLAGGTLVSPVFGPSAWVEPGGLSFDDDEVLEALYVDAADGWLAAGISDHYVWVATEDEQRSLGELGFAPAHQRGARLLSTRAPAPLPPGYRVRRGGPSDLESALELDDLLRRHEEAGPSYALGLEWTGQREEWTEVLSDPETTHWLVEFDRTAVAQCVTFPLPERVGTRPSSVHLGSVVVAEAHRGRGVALGLVERALFEAAEIGAEVAETSWRVTNRVAARHWARAGFVPTYRRMHRHVSGV